jgi:hypothetical protein
LSQHVTVDDLTRFRTGALPADEALRVGRHLAECRGCAAAGRRSQDAARASEGFRSALLDDTPAERRLGPRWMQAAAAIGVIGIVAALLYRAISATSPAPGRPAHVQIPRSLTARTDYGNAGWSSLVNQAMESGRFALPDLTDLRPSGGTVRSSDDRGAQKLDPRGVVVETDRPRFSWPATPRGSMYRVVIYRGEREVMSSAELKKTTYVPERPLDRGAIYQWQVLVTNTDGTMEVLPSPPSPPALIRVLSAADAANLAEARRRFPADPLLAGVLEARAGLIDEARRDLAAAARQHPNDMVIARLRDSLPAWHEPAS